MSAPVSSFSKLSLRHKMEEPQGSERGLSGLKGKGRVLAEDEDGSSTSEDDYDSEGDGNEEGTFETPNPHILAIDHCRQYGSRYAFQMADAEVRQCGLRIDDSETGISCSCDNEGSCRHTQWLLHRLGRLRRGTRATAPTPSPHALVSSLGLSRFCETFDWELREGADSDSEETTWKIQKDYSVKEPGHPHPQTLIDRIRTVRDIVATLSNSPTDDFRRDLFDSPSDLSVGRIYTPQDLEATVSRLLILDDDVYGRFHRLIKPDIRATSYFSKMALKAQDSCRLLDKYCEVGPTGAGGTYDIIWCAQRLIDIVSSISINVTERQPLSRSSREEAARALIIILSMVVKERNHDVYQNIQWPRRRVHGEPQIHRNLYQRLIGSTGKGNPAGGTFVIEALQDLPEAKRFIDDLEDVYGLLETVGWSAPKAYLEKLGGLIARLKGGSGPSPSSSTGKRSASSMERAAKRMK